MNAHRALHAFELALLVAITIDIAYMILRKPRRPGGTCFKPHKE